MIPIPIFAYKWIAIGGVILILGGATWVQTKRLDAVKKEYTEFVEKVKALGEAQEAIAKAKDAESQKAKERADEQNRKAKRDLAGLYDAYSKLLNASSYSSQLPPAAADSPSPDSITFDRAALDRGLAVADGILQSGAAKILSRGDEAIADLDTARAWAADRAR